MWLVLQKPQTDSEPRAALRSASLSQFDRSFELIAVLHGDRSDDELLQFSCDMHSVLQRCDRLSLDDCDALCEAAQEVLSELELMELRICIDDLSSLVQLPSAEFVRLTPNLRDDDFFDCDGTFTHSTCLSWAAVKSARAKCEVVLDFDQRELKTVTPSNCFTQLHVTDAPMGTDQPWCCVFRGWKSVTGITTSRTSDGFELRNQAALDLQ